MKENLLKEVREYIKTNDETLLYNAMLYEIAYQYDYIKSDYADFENVNLTLEDLEDIANELVCSYYLNEGLNELIDQKLYNYTENK